MVATGGNWPLVRENPPSGTHLQQAHEREEPAAARSAPVPAMGLVEARTPLALYDYCCRRKFVDCS